MFTLVAIALSRMISLVEERGDIEGLEVGRERVRSLIYSLQTIASLIASVDAVKIPNLNHPFKGLGCYLGIKISISKSSLVGTNVNKNGQTL